MPRAPVLPSGPKPARDEPHSTEVRCHLTRESKSAVALRLTLPNGQSFSVSLAPSGASALGKALVGTSTDKLGATTIFFVRGDAA